MFEPIDLAKLAKDILNPYSSKERASEKMIEVEFDTFEYDYESYIADGAEADGSSDPETKPRFTITDDFKADWAVQKINAERSEQDRLLTLINRETEQLNRKAEIIKSRFENRTAFLTSALESYFDTVPHRDTKTTAKYALAHGELVRKLGGIEYQYDEQKLTDWLTTNANAYIQTKVTPKWGEFKKTIEVRDGKAYAEDGKQVSVITVGSKPDKFEVTVK
jgi:hypothetical protein